MHDRNAPGPKPVCPRDISHILIALNLIENRYDMTLFRFFFQILSSSSSSAASVNRPSLSLAHKMKGFRQDVQKRISRLRSRSAERISQRSTVMGGRSPDRGVPPPPESPRVSGGHILPSPTLNGQETTYTGPFLGRAKALVDYTPSPYDKDALRFKVIEIWSSHESERKNNLFGSRFQRGDVIDVISMNPSGLWKGKCENRVGNFKFINVEILPQPRSQSQPRAFRESPRPRSSPERAPHDREAHKKAFGNNLGSRPSLEDWGSVEEGAKLVNRPKTVDELLRKIGLEVGTSWQTLRWWILLAPSLAITWCSDLLSLSSTRRFNVAFEKKTFWFIWPFRNTSRFLFSMGTRTWILFKTWTKRSWIIWESPTINIVQNLWRQSSYFKIQLVSIASFWGRCYISLNFLSPKPNDILCDNYTHRNKTLVITMMECVLSCLLP